MRMPLVVANWKMNTTLAEGISLAERIKTELDAVTDVEKVLCPPFISLVPIFEVLNGSSLKMGAQNIHFEERGAYTGEISPVMLKGLCEFVIIGHSERRIYFNESSEIINKKIKAALKAGLKPILCVGESLKEKESGRSGDVITEQIESAFDGVREIGRLTIAYEPVWAIGTGKPAVPRHANYAVHIIRETLASIYGEDFEDWARIIYGGSITPDNIADFMREKDIDGALVGGASLRASDFIAIVKKTAEVKAGG